jgi:adenylylsulfate kinase-like enzyme
MNGDPRESIRQVERLSKNLTKNGLVIYTLKTTGVSSFSEINELYRSVVESADTAGLGLLAKTHLTYNRNELTLFFKSRSSD